MYLVFFKLCIVSVFMHECVCTLNSLYRQVFALDRCFKYYRYLFKCQLRDTIVHSGLCCCVIIFLSADSLGGGGGGGGAFQFLHMKW